MVRLSRGRDGRSRSGGPAAMLSAGAVKELRPASARAAIARRPRAQSPSRRKIAPSLCIASRAAFSTRASNTGARSKVDWLITCSTSAVAVCCSSASLVSLNRRTFSIAITAWSEKDSASAISLSLNAPARARPEARRRCTALAHAAARTSVHPISPDRGRRRSCSGQFDGRPVGQVQHRLSTMSRDGKLAAGSTVKRVSRYVCDEAVVAWPQRPLRSAAVATER